MLEGVFRRLPRPVRTDGLISIGDCLVPLPQIAQFVFSSSQFVGFLKPPYSNSFEACEGLISERSPRGTAEKDITEAKIPVKAAGNFLGLNFMFILTR
jgi:hypothetical protein